MVDSVARTLRVARVLLPIEYVAAIVMPMMRSTSCPLLSRLSLSLACSCV